MTNEVSTTKDFQERMFERIRGQIGDLMTTDDLKKIVDAAIEKAFFEKQKVATGKSYGAQYEEIDPVFVVQMRELLKPAVSEACSKWMNDNKEAVTKVINDLVAANVFGLVQQHLNSTMQSSLQVMIDQLRKQGMIL